MKKLIARQKRREKRKARIRRMVTGSGDRPRISVFKSNKHVYLQVINDLDANTILSISNTGTYAEYKPTVKDAAVLGEAIGRLMIEKGLTSAVCDRNGYLYHGVVKSLIDGVRKAGVVI